MGSHKVRRNLFREEFDEEDEFRAQLAHGIHLDFSEFVGHELTRDVWVSPDGRVMGLEEDPRIIDHYNWSTGVLTRQTFRDDGTPLYCVRYRLEVK